MQGVLSPNLQDKTEDKMMVLLSGRTQQDHKDDPVPPLRVSLPLRTEARIRNPEVSFFWGFMRGTSRKTLEGTYQGHTRAPKSSREVQGRQQEAGQR